MMDTKKVTVLCKKDVDVEERNLFKKGQQYYGTTNLDDLKLEVGDETFSDCEIAYGKQHYSDDEWFQEHFEVIREEPLEYKDIEKF